MATKTEPNGAGDMLQPEVMSREELIATLKQKKVEVETYLDDLDKTALVQVYYKNILPMPQRKYRLNRRGKVATKQQVVINKSRKRQFDKISIGESSGKQSTGRTTAHSKGVISSFNLPKSPPAGDRLKPPPGVSTDRKIIRLNSKSSDSSLSGVVIRDRSSVKSPNSSSPQTKSSSLDVVKTKSADSTTSEPKSFKVNRITFSSGDSSKATLEKPSSTTKMDVSAPGKTTEHQTSFKKTPGTTPTSDEEVPRKKFKAISIAWP